MSGRKPAVVSPRTDAGRMLARSRWTSGQFYESSCEAFVKEASRGRLVPHRNVRRLLADLGEKPYAASSINLEDSFTAMANGAGLLRENQTLDAFANDTNLLLGVFMLEDVGVTLCAHALQAVDLMWSRELITVFAAVL